MCHESSFLTKVLLIVMFTKITEQCSNIESNQENEAILYNRCPNTKVTDNPFDLISGRPEEQGGDILNRRIYCREHQQKFCNNPDRTLTTKKKLKGSKNHKKRLKKKKKFRKKKKNKPVLK